MYMALRAQRNVSPEDIHPNNFIGIALTWDIMGMLPDEFPIFNVRTGTLYLKREVKDITDMAIKANLVTEVYHN